MRIKGNSTDITAPMTNAGTAGAGQTGEEFTAALEKATAKHSGMDDKEKARLKSVCKDMEAVYLNIMLKQMRATVPKSGLLGSSSQEEIFRSLLDSELTKEMAKGSGIGLGDMLYRQLTLEEETKQKSQAPK